MIDFRSGREPKSSSFDYIQIRIASPEEIRGPRDSKERERLELQGQRTWWSWGEVTKPESINSQSFTGCATAASTSASATAASFATAAPWRA